MPDALKPVPQHQGDWSTRHIWQVQPVRDVLGLLAILGVLYLGSITRVVTVPLLLAMALAYMFEPLVRKMTSRGRMARKQAAALIIIVCGVVVVIPAAIGLTVGAVQGARGAQTLAKNVEWLVRSIDSPQDPALRGRTPGRAWANMRDWAAQQKLRQIRHDELMKAAEDARAAAESARTEREAKRSAREAELVSQGSAPERARETAIAEFPEPARNETSIEAGELQPPGPVFQAAMWGVAWAREHQEQIGKQALRAGVDWVNSAFQAVSSVGFMAFGAFLTAFFFYFTCSGYGRVRSFWEGLIPERRKTKAIEMLQQMDRVIAGFIRGRLTICGCLIVYYTLAYWLIGVPGFVILGPVVGALSLLPYMSGLGAPVAMLLVWLDPSAAMVDVWWWIIGAPIGVSMIAQGLDDYVLTPAIQGKETGMDMPTILFASLAGGAIAGVYGLLIAIPAAACIKIVIREIVWPRFRAWATGKASDFLPIEEK